MGNRKKLNKFTYALLALALALVAAPALGATGPGSITITDPVASSAHGGTVSVEWIFRSGEYVKSSTTKVNVYVTNNGITWKKIANQVPIRSGGIEWNAGSYADAPYAIRALVYRTPVRSTVSPVFIDNTKPTVDIVRPSQGQVIVDDATPSYAVVAGSATLVADARDSFSGISAVKWYLDDEEIASGSSASYNFSAVPGAHVLKAVAFDAAGNSSEDAMDIVALPGPSGLGTAPDVPDAPEVPTLPQPDPSSDPTLPTPDASTLPTVPSPDPSLLPTAPTPNPSESPAPPVDPTTLLPDALPSP